MRTRRLTALLAFTGLAVSIWVVDVNLTSVFAQANPAAQQQGRKTRELLVGHRHVKAPAEQESCACGVRYFPPKSAVSTSKSLQDADY